jgi:hypothetical protein
MPAIMTHDFFGRDILTDRPELCGGTRTERDAFLLGNQGPDPLFYLVIDPRMHRMHRFGSLMHNERPTALLQALAASLSVLDEAEKPIGTAYAHGFLCHYLLDSHMHPLVFSWEYRLCDAGVTGLTRENGSEVHGFIERELDEMVLFARTGLSIAEYAPTAHILQADDKTLDTIEKIYAFMALTVYGQVIRTDLFRTAVHDFRRVQHMFYSPTGTKRSILAGVEERVRPYSLLRSMAHRPVKLESSWFENRGRQPWENPFTGRTAAVSFWDIYEQAHSAAVAAIASFDAPGFDGTRARKITGDLNFSGEPAPDIEGGMRLSFDLEG